MKREMLRKRKKLIIAMDGPAGVGKSTVGHLVAKRLGYFFLNTGEMYRALTWKALKEGTDLKDSKALAKLARSTQWSFQAGENRLRVCIDGEVIGSQIRAESVSRNSGAIAGVPEIRRHLRRIQRRLGREGGVVMEGRDITTNVFPDADFKFYLDASLKERAKRRYRQLQQQDHEVTLKRIEEGILSRDMQDFQRKINPLRQAQDAIFIDSTEMSLHKVAQKILNCIKQDAKRR